MEVKKHMKIEEKSFFFYNCFCLLFASEVGPDYNHKSSFGVKSFLKCKFLHVSMLCISTNERVLVEIIICLNVCVSTSRFKTSNGLLLG